MERRITLSKPNHTAPVVGGSADLSGAKGSIKVEHKDTQYNTWNDNTDFYDFTYELINSNEGSASTPIELGESTNQYVTGYQASSDTWRGTSAEFLITATHTNGNADLTANFNIVVEDPYYEEPPAGLGGTPPPPPPPPPPESDENRAGDGPVDDGVTLEYTTGIKVLEDVIPESPLVYDGSDLIITLDLRNIIYKPSALNEIISPAFKSY